MLYRPTIGLEVHPSTTSSLHALGYYQANEEITKSDFGISERARGESFAYGASAELYI